MTTTKKKDKTEVKKIERDKKVEKKKDQENEKENEKEKKKKKKTDEKGEKEMHLPHIEVLCYSNISA